MNKSNTGRFFMPRNRNPLLDEIETPEGEMKTDAYTEIKSLLEQKVEDLSDRYSTGAQMYAVVERKFNELMELLKS